MNRKKLTQVVCLMICFLMMMSIAWLREGRLFGHDLTAPNHPEAPIDTLPTARTTPDGATVINTSTLGADLSGYGGPVPLDVYIRDGRIERIEVLPYHSLGAYKWEQLNIPYTLGGVQPPSHERVINAERILRGEQDVPLDNEAKEA